MTEFIQLHFLTSYPPANLNRDDLGRPKTAVFGGTQRVRVSSQSLKRAWRTSEVFQSEVEQRVGKRTKELASEVRARLIGGGIQEKEANEVALNIVGLFKDSKKKGEADAAYQETDQEGEPTPATKSKRPRKSDSRTADDTKAFYTDQLVHWSVEELKAVDDLVDRVKKGHAPVEADYKALLTDGHGTADIALFGRMIAQHPGNNVEAAAQVAHALSVHRVSVEDDYFTAVDDLNTGEVDAGAAHIGTTEFAAALLYHYVCINWNLLLMNLAGNADRACRALRGLVQACATVAPSGKQNSFASRARASYFLAERGSQQPRSLSVAFLRNIESEDLLAAAVRALKDTRKRMDIVYGNCWDSSVDFDVQGPTGSLDVILGFVAPKP